MGVSQWSRPYRVRPGPRRRMVRPYPRARSTIVPVAAGVGDAVAAVLPGVLVTVIAWALMAQIFAAYLVRFNTFASTYASLSGLFAAMFFTYLAALVLILGGEVNRVLEVRRIMRMQRFRAEDAEV